MDSRALLKNPEFGAQIATVTNAFSYLEMELGESLAKLLGTQAETGISMYLSLTSTAGQLAILEAAARVALKGKRQELFMALVSLVRRAAKDRNKVAHGLWARSHKITDKVLLIPPRVYLELRGKKIAGRKAPGIERDKIMVYDLSDFEQIRAMIDRVTGHFSSFWWMVESKGRRWRSLRATLSRKLNRAPDIREALSRLRRGQKNS